MVFRRINGVGVLLLFLLLLLIACKNENAALIDDFERLEESIESDRFLHNLKTLPEDSLHRVAGIFYGEVTSMIKDLKRKKEKHPETIDSLITKLNREQKIEILVIAFQKYLNGVGFNLENIENQVSKLREIRRLEEKRQRKELIKLIEGNDLKWEPGDTMNLIFQLKEKEGYRTIFFNRYPRSKDFSFADDTLKMRGVLLEKFYGSGYSIYYDEESHKYFDLIFKLKIITLDKEVNYWGDRIKVGDEFDLHLEAYGLKIE